MPRKKHIIALPGHYQQLSDRFYETMSALGYGQHTSRSAQLAVEYFLCFTGQQGTNNLKAITNVHLHAYHHYLKHRPNYNKGGTLDPKTIYHQLHYVDIFFEHNLQQGMVGKNPFDGFVYRQPKTTAVERTVISREELQLLYNYTKNETEKALLALAYGCGLRAEEIENLNINDINLEEQVLTVRRGKGNRRRAVPLARKVVRDLSAYLKIRLQQPTLTHAFLLNHKQRRMREYTGNRMLKKLIERTKDETLQRKEISLHNLRHSIATHLIEEGLSLEKVRDFLGHYHLETTEIYTHIAKHQLRELINV